MPETPPSLENHESKDTSSLSPRNASRSSTPSISHFDGTPLFLYPNAQQFPPRRHDSPSPQDMAIKPIQPPANDHAGLQTPRQAILKANHLEHTRLPQRERHSALPFGDHSPGELVSWSAPPLGDLARLFRHERFQVHKERQAHAYLHLTQVSIARTSRLLCIARTAQQILAECIRSEDKQSFANLFGAFHDAVANSAEPMRDSKEKLWNDTETFSGYPDSFVDCLPDIQRTALLGLVSKLRWDSAYLADRFSSLTQAELLALLPGRNVQKSSESVFESSVRSASRVSRHLGYVVDSQTDLLTALEHPSPLELLIQLTGSLDKELRHDPNAQDIWATVCARLISEKKRGGEKVVPAVIDIWIGSSPWPGKARLAEWVDRILQDGAFILDQPSRQSFRVRVEGRQDSDSEEEARAEAFFSRAVLSLLQLLADPNGASAIPDDALNLCRSICDRMPPFVGQHDAFCNFVLIRWLFNSFVANAVILPETHGNATERFISDNARQKILREVVVRTQKIVFNVLHPLKYAASVAADLTSLVGRIADRFQHQKNVTQLEDIPRSGLGGGFIALSPADVTTIIDGLFPRRRPASLISDSDVARSGLQSSASSVSGFSLFPSPNSSNTTLAYPLGWHSDPTAPTHSHSDPVAKADVSLQDLSTEDLQMESEASHLQDVRAAVEELAVTGRFQAEHQFSIVCFDTAHGIAATQAMRLRDSSMREGHETLHGHPFAKCSADHQLLGETLKHLLDEFDDASISYSAQHCTGQSVGPWLLQTLERRTERLRDQGDFVQAHVNMTMHLRCEEALSGESPEILLNDILWEMERSTEASLERTYSSVDKCDVTFKSLSPALELKQKNLQAWLLRCRLLRDKMVFIADVRTSAAYDEVRSIASALNVMGKPKKPLKTRAVPPLRHWSGSRISSNNLHLKTEAQILDLMSAPANQGGPNKLSDDQSKVLASWLASNRVQNLCVGEERLQKLCMEVRKAIDTLTAGSSPLWASSLFARDCPQQANGQSGGAGGAFWSPQTSSRFDALRLHTHAAPAKDGLSSTASSHPLSARSSRDYLETRSPTVASRSSVPFWSPTMTEAMSPSSTTSVGSMNPQAGYAKAMGTDASSSRSQLELQTDLREHITSLLLSEVTTTMFNDGSETDQAFWSGLGGVLAKKHMSSLRQLSGSTDLDTPEGNGRFDFQLAYETLMDRFSATCDPAVKVKLLVEVDALLGLQTSSKSDRSSKRPPAPSSRPGSGNGRQLPTSDSKVNGFRKLFCARRTRPAAVFRDLQYIAALIPSIAVDYSAKGMAFLHASLAILGLKREICNIMVETADSIIAYDSNNRGNGRTSSSAQQQQRDSAAFSSASQTPPAEDIATYTMADAAHLLQICAKEGDAVAQRELGTLYLTNPELMDHIIAPLARPREVFKEELESKWRKNRDPARCDPLTMCVAHHWMSLSAAGGDALAREYLKQREEIERLP